jgi:Tfp pilus assembly protein PilF
VYDSRDEEESESSICSDEVEDACVMLHKVFLTLVLSCLLVSFAAAQTVDGPDARSGAIQLSAQGQFRAAVDLLEPYVQRHPEDVESWILLAQNRYWLGDVSGADRSFREALARHPERDDLRIAYARFLAEQSDRRAAQGVLRPIGSGHADAEALRGTLAWWAGDLTSAARHFENVLRADENHSEALVGLNAIRAGARPWLRASVAGGRDNQPLTELGVRTQSGVFVTPLQSIQADIRHARFQASESSVPIMFASAAHTGYWPAIRLESDISGGALFRPETTLLIGRLGAGIRLPGGFNVGAHWERRPYFYTEASVSQAVFSSQLQAGVAFDNGGWLGEAAARREAFMDGNEKHVLFGWLMAPLVNTDALVVQLGYAFGYQNTSEHRFTPVLTSTPGPNQLPTWEGRYIPYHTPINEQVHSITGNVVVRAGTAITLRSGGSYAVLASEDAPFVYLWGRAPMVGIDTRAINPWTIRAGVEATLTSSIVLHLDATHLSTAWYEASTLALSLYSRF